MGLYSKALVCLLPLTGWTAQALAQDAEPEGRRVQVAVMLDHREEPVIAEARCRVETRCSLVSWRDAGLDITLELHRGGASETGKLSIWCRGACSFKPGQSHTSFRDERHFELYRGVDSFERLLVLRQRSKMGELYLIIE